ncbi:MAG: lysophospholipid acyltransferase family protein [Acutalibacteraceae bacterium]|nr:lysophospholipid acyltransferase family protein [Acutalibacteraceae bacterium]
MKVKRPRTWAYRMFGPLLWLIFRLYYSPKLFGKGNIPKKGAVVVCSNHKHVLDQCLAAMSTLRPINYMAKAEYFQGKFAWFFKLAGCICVNRNGHDEEAKASANAVLQSNGALGIFPEGTRNKTNNLMGEFKYGAASLACKNGAMMVPVAVTGEYKFRSKSLCARIGEPFSTKGMSVEEANKKLHSEIVKMIKENLDAGYGTADEFERMERFEKEAKIS